MEKGTEYLFKNCLKIIPLNKASSNIGVTTTKLKKLNIELASTAGLMRVKTHSLLTNKDLKKYIGFAKG
ncbi:hypothetical protein SD074_21350 [Prolixibacter sp. SD074]|nr:hypothetical protein SD074_21350 [Prolixibacter sp. SD074]